MKTIATEETQALTQEFKMARGWFIFTCIAAPLLISLFLFMLVMPFVPALNDGMGDGAAYFFVPLSLVMIAVMVLGWLDAIKGRFLISEDSVKSIGVFSVKTLLLEDIKGFRVSEHYIFIEPQSSNQKKIKISLYLGRSQDILNWLQLHFPDLDLLHAEQEEQQILQNEELGWTLEQREEKLQKARKTAKILNWAGGLVAAWTLFWPQPYAFAILVCLALPVIVVCVLKLFSGLIRLDERKDSAYPSVLWAVLGPCLSLAIRALLDFNIFSFDNLWVLMGLVVVTFLVPLLLGSKEFSFTTAKGLAMFAGIFMTIAAYGYGAVVTVNCVFDTSAPEFYEAEVTGKRISTGKTTTYYLELTPWGPQTEADDVSVSKELYELVDSGDEVSVYFMKGYLGVPWFMVTE
ncbi:hypothetical protein FVR03_09090 [Pontibacter qinzhouensis]|uniref:DUF3592 domain-containing protein n=1 Tax=Pontibacter qinzhouensis TaxID=2603253 RepID=A0A5C8KBU5_9BACT|nr:hypothetical protein [Pontibacter qinzhouensis]TXK47539.1 hypothetical protein FVR03_09090 [Pontibacter qinzhouensis]